MENYFLELEKQHKTGQAREHAYRPALKSLFDNNLENITATNDPKRSEHGAPDFILTKAGNSDFVLGYAEAKDINTDLDITIRGEQLKRYFGYSNLILTNYIDFRFYRNGEEWCEPITIASFEDGILTSRRENYDALSRAVKDFYSQTPEKIRSANRLTKIMGGRARRIRDNVSRYLEEENDKNLDIIKIYEVIKKNLIHDITHIQFADMYAQTLVYGLFVARYHDTTAKTFSRQEARDLIPVTNPFLRDFFDHIAGANFDKRLRHIVDELCEIFAVSDVKDLMNNYRKDRDPVIHFYEDFLSEYDNDLRKRMGVFYTPAPVVSFIVRAVDEILKKDFNLVNGIADTSKIQVADKSQKQKYKKEIHRVQILDPATGTGTFLNEIIKYIHNSNFIHESGLWESYVNKELLPRLHGFELMMASYTIAHLKLGMTLRETGANELKERVGIYLTNSLEEAKITPDDLFGSFGLMDTITKESSEASRIKSEYPVMVIVGNPPYSVSSSNKGDWIQNEIKVYKENLNEKKINLDDDYIKFIRFGEHLVEKNQMGILAMITNNSFIDGITHRQMRKHLLETFDDIYILDLHGNSKKKEISPDNTKDENVFDIQQGVSINIFVRRTSKNKQLGVVHHAELYGKRTKKYEKLNECAFEKITWNKLNYSEPHYFFVPKDFKGGEKYRNGFKLDEIFYEYNSGTQTKRDSLTVHYDDNSLREVLDYIKINQITEIRQKYNLPADGRDWTLKGAKEDITVNTGVIVNYAYKPFDTRKIYFTGKTKGFIAYPRTNLSKDFLEKNFGLCLMRSQVNTKNFSTTFVVNAYPDINFYGFQTYIFPIYRYPDTGSKITNLKKDFIDIIEGVTGPVSPEEIFDYLYAILYSPIYRETYREFLKIDFPRIPYPKSKEIFWKLTPLGKQLRELHLLESKELEPFNLGITFNGEGGVIVEKLTWKDSKVYLNSYQYFENIPKEVFDFYIGGYQPAQKWLKDRKGRTLIAEDIIHYKKMCVAMKRTIEIMREIDKLMN